MASQGRQGVTSARQLADRLGLSVATVSRALNNHPDIAEETRVRVLKMADSAGYIPRVGRRPTNVIGLVYPTDPVRADYGNFESAMLAGILEGVNEQRFDVTFINIGRDRNPSDSYTQFFRAKGVRGVIVRTVQPHARLAEEIADDGFPCVVIADRSDQPNVNYVCSDSRADSMRAVQHLVHLGHRRIALGVHSVLDRDHRDRRDGYLDALREAGMTPDPTLMLQARASMEGGATCINRLLSLPDPPTAVYFTDPLTTVGALHRCLVLGVHVPKDLSVVGFDDGDVRYKTFPQYTAVCQDAAQMGLEAARWLTRSLAAGGVLPAFRVHRPTSLSMNDSTGAPPARPVRLSHSGGRVLASN
ncbi:MAG: LacI family DNA-binding transcriptional regulator [Phycisphaerales bacterium]|nr:LacI family DNA-binding transcriptional regulator [Phycisphaerales bacterium]